jgi:hypothetical protein
MEEYKKYMTKFGSRKWWKIKNYFAFEVFDFKTASNLDRSLGLSFPFLRRAVILSGEKPPPYLSKSKKNQKWF